MSVNPHCRISAIKFKNGGEVRLLPKPERGLTDANIAEVNADTVKLVEAFRRECGGVAGLLVIGFSMDGQYDVNYNLHGMTDVSMTILPAYVAEIMRNELTRWAIEHKVDPRALI